MRKTLLAMCALLVLAAGAEAGELGELKGRPTVELYGGYFSGDSNDYGIPGADISLDGTAVFGLRCGGFLVNRWSVEISGGYAPSQLSMAGAPDTDTDVWLGEASLHYHYNRDGRAVFSVFGGPGWIRVAPAVTGVEAEESLTLHAGASVMWRAGEHFYVRPDVRYRFVEGVKFGASEGRLHLFEGTVAAGWLF